MGSFESRRDAAADVAAAARSAHRKPWVTQDDHEQAAVDHAARSRQRRSEWMPRNTRRPSGADSPRIGPARYVTRPVPRERGARNAAAMPPDASHSVCAGLTCRPTSLGAGLEHRDGGKRLALDELEERAATRRNVRDALFDAVLSMAASVSPPPPARTPGSWQGLGNGLRALAE